MMIPDTSIVLGRRSVKATVVKARSPLIDKKCQAGCRNKIAAGHAVLVQRLDRIDLAIGVNPWFVMHVDCVRAKCDAAPEGLPPVNAAANIANWRRELIAEGAIPVR